MQIKCDFLYEEKSHHQEGFFHLLPGSWVPGRSYILHLESSTSTYCHQQHLQATLEHRDATAATKKTQWKTKKLNKANQALQRTVYSIQWIDRKLAGWSESTQIPGYRNMNQITKLSCQDFKDGLLYVMKWSNVSPGLWCYTESRAT